MIARAAGSEPEPESSDDKAREALDRWLQRQWHEREAGLHEVNGADGEARITMTLEKSSYLTERSNPAAADPTIEVDARPRALFIRSVMNDHRTAIAGGA